MALAVGVNSFVSLADAEAYFADRLDVAAWTEATDPQKEAALVTATSILDGKTWAGYAVAEDQDLAFPRLGSYFDPKVGYAIVFPEDVPDRVKKATYELAYHLLNNDGLLDDTGSVDGLTIGPVRLFDLQRAATVPSIVFNLIRPMLMNGGRNQWWRAN